MDWKKWIQSGKRVFSAPILRDPFYTFTLNLLSLLLPFSFLLLSRLSRAQYVLSSNDLSQSNSFLLFLFLYTNPTLLHILVSFVSINALLHGLTVKFSLPKVVTSPVLQPRLCTAWILLCTLQVCVGLGIEGTIASGIWTIDNDVVIKSIFLVRFTFFIGLHETMVHWMRTFVKPVVDDTVFGGPRNTWRVESLVRGVSFGALWWWRLRDEAEGFLLVVQLKREVLMGLAITDLLNWWLYYLTVTIGVVRLLRGFLWFGEVLLCRRRPEGKNGVGQETLNYYIVFTTTHSSV